MKYVIIRKPDGAELPFFCLPPVKHDEFARALIAQYPRATVVSAGFIRLTTDRAGHAALSTFGWSESLNLGPREDDSGILSALYRVTIESASFMLPAQRVHQPAA